MSQTEVEASATVESLEKEIDTLIAISVVSKRLAEKLRQDLENPKEKNDGSETNEEGN